MDARSYSNCKLQPAKWCPTSSSVLCAFARVVFSCETQPYSIVTWRYLVVYVQAQAALIARTGVVTRRMTLLVTLRRNSLSSPFRGLWDITIRSTLCSFA